MGFRLKGNHLFFLADLQLFQCFAILFGLFNLSVCLFEDQIGKFDWKQNYVGQLKFAHFDTVSTAKKIICATEENVVAALNLKSGQIIWRQVLERAQHGQIQYLSVDSEVITVSGNNPWLVRSWDPVTGRLLLDWSLTLPSVQSREIRWLVSDGTLVQVVAVIDSHIEVTYYNALTGQNKGTTSKISTPWISDFSRCILSGTNLICMSGSNSDSDIYVLDLVSEENVVAIYPIQNLVGNTSGIVSISPLEGENGFILTRNGISRIILLNQSKHDTLPNNIPEDSSVLIIDRTGDEKIILYTTNDETSVTVKAVSLTTRKEISELNAKFDYIGNHAKLFAGICTVKKDGNTACRYLFSTKDHTVTLLQNSGKLLWTREESLSHIVAVDLLDLPVSDLDASIESEFDNKEGDFLGMLTRRLTSQVNQLQLSLLTVLKGRVPQTAAQEAGLVRDEFGLHKIIVAATNVGKLYGIDNLNGQILWKRHLNNVVPFNVDGKESMLLFVQRTTRHFPRPAQCALVARDKNTGEGVVFMFNPITGESTDKDALRTGAKIKQALLLHKHDEDFVRGVLILDEHDHVSVYPKSDRIVMSDMVSQTFMFVADTTTGVLTGYMLAYSTPENLRAIPAWQVKLGNKDQHIISIVSKSSLERVHSQGRVLIDRSVLYKYVNPNLVAVVVHGTDPVHKYVLNVYLVDVVSGVVVFSISHKRAKEPVHLVHSENWLAYSYYNDKWRRTEIGTLELYEGKMQSNDTAFSSLSPPLLPIVEKQSYILPAQVDGMQVTLTEKGIASKHVLMALSSGGVIEMPWMFLDPRRPSTVTPEMREEGVVPYIPELPMPYEAIINYNRSLARVRGIHTSPSGLESTCLVLVHGLDLYYTRVSPSKTFDLLKDDFDYYLIVIVLAGLLVTSYVTKHLASRKALKQAWK